MRVQIRAPEGSEEQANRIINLKDVAATDGVARIDLGEPGRGAKVSAEAHVRGQNPERTAIHRGETVVKLRPDLVVAAIHAPPQTLSTRPIDVVADISELNLETGAKATVKLMLGPTPVAEPQSVTVPAGGSFSLPFKDVKLTTATSAELTVRDRGRRAVRDGRGEQLPHDEGRGHRARARPLERPRRALGGFGAQFNQHVYAAITPKPPGSLPDLEAKVKALEPQLVRIFFHEVQERDPDQLASFYKTVELAQEAGATINITYHTAVNAKFDPPRFMGRSRSCSETLVKTNGLANVRWVTIQNEPNTTWSRSTSTSASTGRCTRNWSREACAIRSG